MSVIKRMFFLSFFMITGLLFVSSPVIAKKKLISVKATTPIVLDAVAEKAWDNATSLTVKLGKLPYKPNNGYPGMKKTNITIKSLYDDNSVYFFIQYKDATKSMARFPWVKQADGSWKQFVKKDSTGHDNTYYEDKLGMYWNINATGFEKKGCYSTCHRTKNGMNNGIKDKSAGRKYTKNEGETVDMWHWKGVRTGPLGIFDDQFVNSNRDPKVNKSWGRKGDSKLGGGYKNNVNKSKTGPAFMNSPYSEDTKYYVTPWAKTKFVDTFKTGDVVPGIVLDAFTGHRADIKVKSHWKNGQWTLEVKRALVTTGKNAKIQDVQFDDMGKTYHFGISVFDNSQINHLFHNGAIEMKFQ